MKLVIALMLGIISIEAMGDEQPLSPVCWPLNFAGITLGVTTDSEVQRLLGKGLFKQNLGDTGGRYFIDSKRTASLQTASYTDAVVGEVTVQDGVFISPSEATSAVSPWFNPQQGFGNWQSLHLGSTKKEVKDNLGEPVKGSSENAWRYDSKCACEVEVFFTLYFEDSKIYKVVFSAPAG
jgi:hypothetical protein